MCKNNVALIPLDNRPVSYILPQQVAKINSNVNIFLPPREITGNLKIPTDIPLTLSWLEENIKEKEIDTIVICLDTIAYGGLIQSRRTVETKDAILKRIELLGDIISNTKKRPKILAFSSIMRISNNNINEEEKEYWNEYGEMLFAFSYISHKLEKDFSFSDKEKLNEIKNIIPPEILEDYLKTRKRNFEINKFYIDLLKDNFFDYLVFSQDDTGKYGLNVREGQDIQTLIKAQNLNSRACVKTGADEIPTNLVVRSLIKDRVSIYPIYSTPTGKEIISKYEDKTIEESVKGQIDICGAVLAENEQEADIILIAHTPLNEQNDHALNVHKEKENIPAIELCLEKIKNTQKPVLLADLACANGADNKLVQGLLAQGIDLKTFYGYAGWNTTGNTLGSLISQGLSRFISEKENSYNEDIFKKLLLTRLGDDWAYQTVVRQIIRAFTDKADLNILKEELAPYIDNIAKKISLELQKPYELSFPWDRTFEVEISL